MTLIRDINRNLAIDRDYNKEVTRANILKEYT
jgi:hypothetical protein